jgi:ribosomal protein L19E
MALKDQTKRVKQLVCRNDVIELIKESEIGKTSLLPHFGHLRSKNTEKRARVTSRPF